MFSAAVFKSGMFENRDGGARRTLARRLNRQARRFQMAHPDPRLMAEKQRRMQAHPIRPER